MDSMSSPDHLVKRPRFPVVQNNSVVSVPSQKQPIIENPGLDMLADAVQQKDDFARPVEIRPKTEVISTKLTKVTTPGNQVSSLPAQYEIPNPSNPNQKIVLTVNGTEVQIGHQQSTESAMMESIRSMPVKNGASLVMDNVDMETEMVEFMRRYAMDVNRNNGRKPQTPVRDLRHMIPLLIMHLYGIKADQSHRKSKVKGMWWNKPSDWPFGVPFCDPNNSKLPTSNGSLSKPKKETLIQMFNFLMVKYNQNIVDSLGAPADLNSVAKTILNAFTIKTAHDSASDNLNLLASVITAREEPKTTLLGRRPSSGPTDQTEPKCLKVANPPQPVSLSQPIAQALSMGNVTHVSVLGPPSHLLKPKAPCHSPPRPTTARNSGGKIPLPRNLSQDPEAPKEAGWDLSINNESEIRPKMSVEVQDDEEEVTDWDPVSEICARNEQKIRYLSAKQVIPKRDMGHIYLVKDMLIKLRQILPNSEADKLSFLEKAHDFSLTLDVCRTAGYMPEKYCVKWSDMQGGDGIIPEPPSRPPAIEELVLDLSELKLADPSCEIVCISNGNRISILSNQDDHSEDVDKFFSEKDEGEGRMESMDELFVALQDFQSDADDVQPSELWDPQMTLDINITDITDCLNDTPPVTQMTIPIPVTVEEMEIDPGPSKRSRRRRINKKI